MPESNTTIVIVGATGDLAQRKLLPALFQLACKGRLPQGLRIVGLTRAQLSDDRYRELMWKGVREFGELAVRQDEWRDFARTLFFVSGDAGVAEHFERVAQRVRELEGDDAPANRLFYLSIAPHLFGDVIGNLDGSGLAADGGGWRGVVIEKPFGTDINSARALNELVHGVFREEQVYRIDHYLGKETVQNLLAFRFANAMFEPVWNRNYIDHVQITVAEEVPVGSRAGYYDRSGVVRDMIQNHVLQLVTLVAMEPPAVADSESLRDKKVEVLRAVRRWTPQQAGDHAVGAQYDGYLGEPGVAPDSRTSTYAALRLFIDNWRWHGVPFYLRTGKAMAQKVSEIVIQFQRPPHVMFTLGPWEDLGSNAIGICVQPDEGVRLSFQAKVPGQGMYMQTVNMDFHYESAFPDQPIPEAYERLLEEALEGDARLFIRSDHIEGGLEDRGPAAESVGGPGRAAAPEIHDGKLGPWRRRCVAGAERPCLAACVRGP